MARLKLTTAAVDRIKPPKTGQDEYFDTLLPSFGLRVSYSGTKSWFVMTRADGKLMRLTLGRHPALSLADARTKAREAIQTAAKGVDPRTVESDRRRQREAQARNTFGMLAEDFMAKHVGPNLRQSTAREYRRVLFGADTKPWRSQPVSSIKKRDVQELLESIQERGSKSASSLTLAYLRKFFNWCVDRDVIEASPATRIKRTPLRSRERVLSEDELKRVWNALECETGPFGPLLKVLLLTGQRRAEVAGMRWDEIRDLDGSNPIWEIPGNRTKNHRTHLVPLSEAVVAILNSMPRTGPFVFTTTGDTPVSGFSKAKARIDQRVRSAHGPGQEVCVEQWALHDLRRTMVTVMNEKLKVPPHHVEAIVNHVTGAAKKGVAGVYNRALYLSERRAALDQWSNHVEQIACSQKFDPPNGDHRRHG